MPDDKTNRGPADRSRINVHEHHELEYWSKKFGVTHDELIAAVNKVGVMAEAVEGELKKKSH